jgi:hypothetical protein
MILFPGRHLMGVLECHQLKPPNNMVELKTHELCVKNQVEFMVQLERVDVEFGVFFFLPNLHPLTHMVKKLRSLCQDMKPGPQGVRILAKPLWTGFHVLTQRSKFFRNASTRGPGFISVSGHETWSTRTFIPEKLGSPCQDMKPGPQGKLMYYYFYHGSDLSKII